VTEADRPAGGRPERTEDEGGCIDRRLLEFLVCPVTRGRLEYDRERQELVSRGANRAYPIHNGIPIMLVDEARILED
jgi:uncharacterized protein YbaR (Trm112 family)